MKGLHPRTCCPDTSVFNYSEPEAARLTCTHRRAGPGGRRHAPAQSRASSLARLEARAHICSRQRGEISPQIHFVSESNMAPTPLRHIFFCLSVGFPKFVSGEKALRRLPQTPAGGPRSPCNVEAAQDGASAPVLLHKSAQVFKITADFYLFLKSTLPQPIAYQTRIYQNTCRGAHRRR